MRIFPVLADTGRPTGSGGVNLLNAGWTFTTAIPLPDGAFTLPAQVISVFIEAPWDQLNRPHGLTLELIDADGQFAEFVQPTGVTESRLQQEIIVAPVPGAPNGTPGMTSFCLESPAGMVRIAAPRRRYNWRITIGDDVQELGFWVNAPAQGPSFGQPGGGS